MVRRGSPRYLYYLARAHVLIQNGEFLGLKKRLGQIYVNTQHGTPIKNMGSRINSRSNKERPIARQWDVLVAGNIIEKTVFCRDLNFSGKVLQTGNPRNDCANRDQIDRDIRKRLDITSSNVALWAPTWRDYAHEWPTLNEISAIGLNMVQNWTILARLHHLDRARRRRSGDNDSLIVPSPDIATEDLLHCADVLITDYSSLAIDFIRSGKPIIHYFMDYELYVAKRGLQWDLRSRPLGIVARDGSELVDALVGLSDVASREKWVPPSMYRRIHALAHAYGHGRASQDVIDWIETHRRVDCLSANNDYFSDAVEALAAKFRLPHALSLRRRFRYWQLHSFLAHALRYPSSLLHLLRVRTDRFGIPLTLMRELKRRTVVVLGTAPSLPSDLQHLRRQELDDALIVGLNRACLATPVDVLLFADNEALDDIASQGALANARWIIRVRYDTWGRKIGGSRWIATRSLLDWPKKRLFMSRNILTAALSLSVRLGAQAIVLGGISLENREYFYGGENCLNRYEQLSDRAIAWDHFGMTSQEVVRRALRDVASSGVRVTALSRGRFLADALDT